jgi:hypothetical protein
MDKAMERELACLDNLSDLLLLKVLELIDDDPADQHTKAVIINKVNDIMNSRLGIAAHTVSKG